MVRLLIAAAVAALSCVPVAGLAATTRYDCTFETGAKRDGNWIPKVLVLQHNEKTGEVIVFDPVIQHFVGKPIAATLSEQTGAKTSFTWSIETSSKGRGHGKQSATMQYRFSYFKNAQPSRMHALPSGYDNKFSGEGTCKLQNG